MDSQAEAIKTAERLFGVLLQTDEDDNYRFAEADILRFVPVLISSFGDPKSSGESAQLLMQRFVAQIDVPQGSPAAEVQAHVDTYLAEHPLNPALLQAFEQFIREEAAELSPEQLGQAFNAFLSSKEDFARLLPENKPDPAKSPMAFLMQSKMSTAKN